MYSLALPVQAKAVEAEAKPLKALPISITMVRSLYYIVLSVSIKACKTVDKDAESSADLANGQYSHGHARQSKGC